MSAAPETTATAPVVEAAPAVEATKVSAHGERHLSANDHSLKRILITSR